MESCHQYLDKLLMRSNYWVKDPLSEKCGRKLLAGILHFDGYSAQRMGLVMVDTVSNAPSKWNIQYVRDPNLNSICILIHNGNLVPMERPKHCVRNDTETMWDQGSVYMLVVSSLSCSVSGLGPILSLTLTSHLNSVGWKSLSRLRISCFKSLQRESQN